MGGLAPSDAFSATPQEQPHLYAFAHGIMPLINGDKVLDPFSCTTSWPKGSISIILFSQHPQILDSHYVTQEEMEIQREYDFPAVHT